MINRFLSVVLLTLVTVAGFFMFQQQDLGSFRVAIGQYAIETNLLIILGSLLVLMFIASLLYHLVRKISAVIAYFGSRRRLRLSGKASQAMVQGLIEMAEGRFATAEKLLLTEIRHNDNALLAYLGAARAAQQLDADNRRDKYLRLAHEQTPAADTAIRLTKAELQISQKQYEQALATLTLLAEESPKHAYVLKLLARVYAELSDWHNLKRILPDIKKQRAMSQEETAELETRVWKGLLSAAAVSRNIKTLMQFWNDIPKASRQDPAIVGHYAQQLIAIDAAGEAEQVLRQYLGNNWNEDIIALYSTIDVQSDNRQLETAEGWLHQHQQNAHLLLALGNICTNRSLWGKARNYYEASIAVRPMPENYLHLARLLEEHMADTGAAQEYYRQGLHLLAGRFGESTERLLSNENDLGKEPDDDKPTLKVV